MYRCYREKLYVNHSGSQRVYLTKQPRCRHGPPANANDDALKVTLLDIEVSQYFWCS